MYQFSLKHQRNGRRVAIAVRFSLPVPKSFKPVHLIKGLLVAVPILIFSFLLNSNFSPAQGQAGTNDASVASVPAATDQNPAQPKRLKTVKAKKPTRAKITVNQLTFKTVKGYRPSQVPVSITQTFRGSHKVYVYAAGETLQLSFDKVDLNRYFGPDELTVRVAPVKSPSAVPRRWKKTIFVGDDGVTMSKEKRGRPQRVALSMPVGRSGVYLVDIATNDDVLIENITSRQRLLAFDERVYFAEGPAYTEVPFKPLLLTTDSTTLAFSANHYTGRQAIKVNDKTYYLYNVRYDQVVTDLGGTTKIEASKGDAIFRGDGLLAVFPAKLIPTSWSIKNVTVASTVTDPSENSLAGNF